MIGIIDYGLGNITAFLNVYRSLGIDAAPVTSDLDLRAATHIILPGVGAFDWAMTRLDQSGLRQALDEAVLVLKKPVLGVCVGMQIMGISSDEGTLPGLGWIEATNHKLDSLPLAQQLFVPHMGWNHVKPLDSSTIFRGLSDCQFYFLHSYYMKPLHSPNILAMTSYGSSFASSVHVDNIYGTQFHPEKSHHWGVHVLKNFAALS